MVKVKTVEPIGGYVSLMEYDSMEGMIFIKEAKKRRIKSAKKQLLVGRSEVAVVIRVDTEKEYVDVSKRKLKPQDVTAFEEQYSNAKTVYQIIRRLGDELKITTKQQLEDLNMNTAWFIDRKYGKKGASFDVFRSAVKMPEILNDCPIDETVREKLLSIIRQRMSGQACKIKSEFDISCFTFEGIVAIREAILEGLKLSTKELEIKITLITHPHFLMTCQAMNRQEGLDALDNCNNVITKAIVKRGGSFKITTKPQVVNNDDEENLKNKIGELNNVEDDSEESSYDSEDSEDEN